MRRIDAIRHASATGYHALLNFQIRRLPGFDARPIPATTVDQRAIMNHSISLSHRETRLVAEELRELLVPSRLQKVFESSSKRLVLQFRAPGTTYHLLVSATANDARTHLVDNKPDQPDHPSPLTRQLRKWLHGAWVQQITGRDVDRILRIDLEAIEPDWEPEDDDERAPRQLVTLVAELLGRHPNLWLIDEDERIITKGPGRILGDRPTEPGEEYREPPPPPDWAETEDVRPILRDVPPDGRRSKALDDHFRQSLRERRRRSLRQSLEQRLEDQFDRLPRRIDNIDSDLERIDDAEEYRRRGELLKSAYGDVEPGDTSVTVQDYFDDDLPSVDIPLDPAKDLQENIEDYFHEYHRLTRARDKVEDRLLESMELRDRIADARRRLERLEKAEELRDFLDELESDRILESGTGQRSSGQKQQAPLPPYRKFTATSGKPILVGRNARKNDKLTTSVARGRDLWLHARNFPGAHVVLRMRKDDELESEDLVDAATLAAYFSEGRRDTVVDITYTDAKYVRKPSGAPPGSVTIGGGGSTISVRLEDDRLERLLDGEHRFR